MNNRDEIKKEFSYYLTNVARSARRTSDGFNLGKTAVGSFLLFIEVDKLFDYAPEKWAHIKSMYDITDPIEVKQIADSLFNDDAFLKHDNANNQGWRSGALSHYVCFINARSFFLQKKDIVKMPEPTEYPSQQIFYGAPGTGKSHTINEITEQQPKENVFRTTFHPDSDYSTFVGCYKPTKVKTRKDKRMNLSLEDLAKELGGYYSNEELGKINGIQKFCFEYYPYIDGEYMSVNVTKLLELAGIPKDYNVEINKYIKFCHLFPKQDPTKITYEFVSQAFTKAYLRAWQIEEPVYLVIEEINRGNCAQIFGDLFQLLDRKDDGFSEYPIKADNDLAVYIGEELSKEARENIPENVKSGEELMLPSNLYIWATMNTSDQSLFPIDSAFKRRWNWVYMPIDTEKENWSIRIGNDYYSWTAFLNKVNDELLTDETAEDKHLGFYFCKASEKKNESDLKPTIITQEAFVAKVLFYLWSDVFKVYGIPAAIGSSKDWAFAKFYNTNGTINEAKVKDLMSKLNISAFTDDTIDIEVMENSAEAKNSTKNTLKSVAFPDGVVFDTSVSVFDAYVKAVEKIGVEKIIPVIDRIKFQRSNRPLISTVKYPELDNKDGFSYYQIGNCYFVKGTHTYTYVRILEVLNELLNVGMTIEN